LYVITIKFEKSTLKFEKITVEFEEKKTLTLELINSNISVLK